MKNKQKFDYKKYISYLRSSDWLIKKSKLVARFLRRKWEICCYFCGSTNNLQIHHHHYRNLYNENLDDLDFLCATCHKRTFNDKENFKKEWLIKSDEAFELFNQNYNGKK